MVLKLKINVAYVALWTNHRTAAAEITLRRREHGARIFDAAQKQAEQWAAALTEGDAIRVHFQVRWWSAHAWSGSVELQKDGTGSHPDIYDIRAQLRHIAEANAGIGKPWFYGQLAQNSSPKFARWLVVSPSDHLQARRILRWYEFPEYAPMEVIDWDEVRAQVVASQ